MKIKNVSPCNSYNHLTPHQSTLHFGRYECRLTGNLCVQKNANIADSQGQRGLKVTWQNCLLGQLNILWPPGTVGLCSDHPGEGSQSSPAAACQVQWRRLPLLVPRPRQRLVASFHCPSCGLWRHQEQVEYFFHLNVLHILRGFLSTNIWVPIMFWVLI